MERIKDRMKRNFTLVEIMVAMAILVILMGFLFEFVIGAQRIWAASRNVSGLYDRAQIAMRWLERDLQDSMYFADREFPGRGICLSRQCGGRYDESRQLTKNYDLQTDNHGQQDIRLKMLVRTRAVKSSAYGTLVEYIYQALDGRLYRREFGPSTGDYRNFLGELPPAPPTATPLSDDDLLAEGLLSFNLLLREDFPSPSGVDPGEFRFAKPAFVKVEMSMYDKDMIPGGLPQSRQDALKQEISRAFSKFIFLNDRDES